MNAPAAARADQTADSAGARLPSARHALVAYLHLAVLWGFAVAQPLFDLLGANAELFATRGSEGFEVVLFAALLALAPPALLVGTELAAGAALGRRGRDVVHLGLVGALAGLFALQVLKRIAGDVGAVVLLAGAGAIAFAAVLAYARARGVRSFLSALAPAPLVFLALFVVQPPIARLVFADEAQAGAASVAARAPIVVVVFDELPLTSLLDARGRIDRRRYPSFAALAARSTWLPNATGVHDRTSKAVPAVLTGQRPRPGSLPIAADHPRSLFTLFGRSYRLNVFEEATSVCPDELCAQAGGGGFGRRASSLASDLGVVYGHVVLPRELARGLPSVSEGWEGFAEGDGEASDAGGGPRRRGEGDSVDRLARGLTRGLRGARDRRFDRFERSLGEGSQDRVLSFEHAFFPHAPFEYLPSGRRYARPGEEPIEGLVPPSGTEPLRDPFAAAQAYQRHLLQVAHADRLLGRVLERLRARGALDRALVVVTADHGASFVPGQDRRTVTRRSFADVASVPLFVKPPGARRARVSDAPAQTIDVLPTVADVLGVRLPWRVDGRSVFDPAVAGRREVTMVQGAQRRARISRGTDDRPISVPATTVTEGRRAALRRKLALFGPDGDPFSLGPRPDLRGRALSELATERPAARRDRIELDDPDQLRAVDPGSGLLPAHLTGRVVTSTPRKRTVAVAVNGRIVATAETFSLGEVGTERFSAMVPESALRPGANAVELLEVVGGDRRPGLRSLGRFGGAPGA